MKYAVTANLNGDDVPLQSEAAKDAVRRIYRELHGVDPDAELLSQTLAEIEADIIRQAISQDRLRSI